ncbi:MAG: AbiU2 domain-containing protein [Limisphaerales bacterium]
MKDSLKVAAEVKAEMEGLLNELGHASTHLHLFIQLRDSVSEFKTEFDSSPLFWSFTRHAHLQAAAIFICRIFDQHKSGSHFPRLLSDIQNNLLLFDREQFCERNKDDPFKLMLISNASRPSKEALKSDIEFCSVRNPLIATLKKWRNNAIAHTNYRVVVGQAAFLENDPLEYEAIQKLIKEGYRMLNYYSTRFQGVEFGSFSQEELNDYLPVLQILKNASPQRE